jgi:hypothetical protein
VPTSRGPANAGAAVAAIAIAIIASKANASMSAARKRPYIPAMLDAARDTHARERLCHPAYCVRAWRLTATSGHAGYLATASPS